MVRYLAYAAKLNLKNGVKNPHLMLNKLPSKKWFRLPANNNLQFKLLYTTPWNSTQRGGSYTVIQKPPFEKISSNCTLAQILYKEKSVPIKRGVFTAQKEIMSWFHITDKALFQSRYNITIAFYPMTSLSKQ